jgi:hypothetical protein
LLFFPSSKEKEEKRDHTIRDESGNWKVVVTETTNWLGILDAGKHGRYEKYFVRVE